MCIGIIKLLMYDWYYDKMEPYFGEDNLKLHYLGTDSSIFSLPKPFCNSKFIVNIKTRSTIAFCGLF